LPYDTTTVSILAAFGKPFWISQWVLGDGTEIFLEAIPLCYNNEAFLGTQEKGDRT
jgi:hypothetical protein